MVTTAPILPSSPVSSGPSSSSSNAVTTGRARTKGTPMRSRTGCLTCRARKLKCDEQKPQCGQCRKGSRECRPSEGIVFRHQQNASMNKDNGDQGQGSQKSFYNNKQSFADDSVWLEIPKNVVFVDSSGSRTQGSDGESQAARASSEIRPHRDDWRPEHDYRTSNDTEPHGLAALSTVATQNEYIFTGSPAVDRSGAPTDDVSFSHSDIPTSAASVPPSGGPQGTMAQSPHSSSLPPSNNHNIDFLLNPSSSISPPVNSRLQDSQERRGSPFVPVPISSHTSARESQMNENVELDHEVAFLLRHYSEGPGYWMDLFDLNQYFSWHVPIKALSNPLLKYAACAYAAKQLGRVNGAKPIVGGLCSQQASMELWPNADKVDWVWYGAKYYDKAIHLLMKELQHDAEGPTPLSTAEAFGQWQAAELCEDGENARKRRRRNSNSRLSSAHSDEVLSATAILSVYEFLDATGPAWNRHLSGVKSLLDITEVGMMPLESQTSPNGSVIPMKRPGLSKARRAVFWNFARQDYLAAFINECQTRLDTEDLVIWTEAGLQIDANGFVRPSNAGHLEDDSAMKEDMISNALVWILSKIVNFIAMGGMGQTPLAYSQQTLLERWYRIHAELDAWYNGLPATFRPCARIEPSRRPKELGGFDDCTFPEVWYSIPMCASTMQHYHLARILLLINKPHESTGRRTTVTNRLQSYRSIENEVRYHSREIVGISLGRLDATARIHALQPLYVSGQCLTEPHERRLIIKLLRGIEADTGWATEYRVKQLLEEWGWTEFPTT